LSLRELLAAAKAKQRYDWDHTADIMALMANLHTTKNWARQDFHPSREKLPTLPMHLDDPAAEYERLIKEKGNKPKGRKRKCSSRPST
jgi:hypothetical protein